MDEIRYISEWVFFANESGNPVSLDSQLDRIYSLTTEYDYRDESPEFIYYLDRIAEDMMISVGDTVGPNPMEILPYKLEYNLGESTDIPEDQYQFYIFYILCRLHQNLDDYEGSRKLAKRYKPTFQEFPYYGKIISLSYVNSDDPDILSNALDNAFDYSRDNPQYPDLHEVVAEVIVILIESDLQYTGPNENLPTDRQKLIRLGKSEIDRALEWENVPAEYFVVKAKIESLNEEYDEAKNSILRALSELSRSRTRYSDLRAEFGRVKNSIETRRQQSRLRNRTDEISSSIDSIESKIRKSKDDIDDLRDEVDEIRQDFQRTFLEFLGFFSAIIAAIVITGQIALEIENPQQTGRLIIISYGGLLFAFGGFAAMLGSTQSKRRGRSLVAIFGLLVAFLFLYWG